MPDELEESLDEFTAEMKRKLIYKRDMHYFTGWNDPNNLNNWKRKVLRLAEKINNNDTKQTIDLANFAMFIWYLTERQNI